MDKADQFEEIINQVIAAGLPSPGAPQNPYFVLFDADGQPWKKLPDQMSAADILEFVDNRFGAVFVGFCKTFPELTTH